MKRNKFWSVVLFAGVISSIVLFAILSRSKAEVHTAIQTITDTVSSPQFIEPKRPDVSQNSVESFSSQIDRLLKNSSFNGACAVLIDGYPVYEQVKGCSNFSTRDTVNFNTTFQLASVSKTITSMSILHLVEKGEINLGDYVTEYIPEFPYKDITIHQLLTHTSGLQNYMYLVDNYWKKGASISNEDVLDLLIKYDLPLDFTPGRRHAYSNTGYAMLALVIERVTGDPYDSWVAENIFKPAGMKDAWAWNMRDDSLHHVIGYTTSRRWRRVYNHDANDEVLGDKSIYCSISDMIHWENAIRQNIFVSDSLMQIAWQPTKIKHYAVPYGYGWRMKKFGNRQAIYHNGLWNGFTATLTFFPEDGLSIILLSNTSAKVSSLTRSIQSKAFTKFELDKRLAKHNEKPISTDDV